MRHAPGNLLGKIGVLRPVLVRMLFKAIEQQPGVNQGVHDLTQSPLSLIIMRLRLLGWENLRWNILGGPALLDSDGLGKIVPPA